MCVCVCHWSTACAHWRGDAWALAVSSDRACGQCRAPGHRQRERAGETFSDTSSSVVRWWLVRSLSRSLFALRERERARERERDRQRARASESECEREREQSEYSSLFFFLDVTSINHIKSRIVCQAKYFLRLCARGWSAPHAAHSLLLGTCAPCLPSRPASV